MISKKLTVLALLGVFILGAAGFGLYAKKMNVEGFRGIGFSTNGVEKEVVEDWIKAFEEVFQKDEVLQEIVMKSDYAAGLEISEGEAMEHLRAAIDVHFSETRNRIHVGLSGSRKQREALDKISQHIFNVSAPLVAQMKPAFRQYYRGLLEGGQ